MRIATIIYVMTNKDKNERMLVARVVVTRDDKVLLIRRSESDGSRGGFWEIPGGIVEQGESFEDAARREVQEETGLTIDELEFDHSSSYEFAGTKRIKTVFRAVAKDTAVKLSHEHDDSMWVDSSNYDNLQLEKPYKEYLDEYFSSDRNNEFLNAIADDITTNFKSGGKLIVFTDGGSRGNPGPSASGYVIMDEEERILMEGGEYLGITTNNQAEYQAVRTALEMCKELDGKSVDFFIDSLLVVNQMNGIYKIKNRDLWPIHESIKQLATEFDSVTYTHVRREKNKLADAKVNEVLDNYEK